MIGANDTQLTHQAPRCFASGKRLFTSKAIAKQFASKATKIFGSKAGIYHCKECRHWHIYTVNKKREQVEREPLAVGCKVRLRFAVHKKDWLGVVVDDKGGCCSVYWLEGGPGAAVSSVPASNLARVPDA